jgi:tRNA(fMet)-specific endonuclease VapC
MSLYLLDTDTVSLYQHGHPLVCAAVAGRRNGAVVISIMTVEEQLSGWYAGDKGDASNSALLGFLWVNSTVSGACR